MGGSGTAHTQWNKLVLIREIRGQKTIELL